MVYAIECFFQMIVWYRIHNFKNASRTAPNKTPVHCRQPGLLRLSRHRAASDNGPDGVFRNHFVVGFQDGMLPERPGVDPNLFQFLALQ